MHPEIEVMNARIAGRPGRMSADAERGLRAPFPPVLRAALFTALLCFLCFLCFACCSNRPAGAASGAGRVDAEGAAGGGGAGTQGGGAQGDAPTVCGQTRSVLVRFADGSPAPGVLARLAALPAEMGGPDLSSLSDPQPDSRAGESGITDHAGTPAPGASILPQQGSCRTYLSRFQSSATDQRGSARFTGLREGTWLLTFSGSADRSGPALPLASSGAQGLPPYGRNGAGGGFVEMVSLLLEEGGPYANAADADLVSRYVLTYDARSNTWMPGVDLAPDSSALPVPLALTADEQLSSAEHADAAYQASPAGGPAGARSEPGAASGAVGGAGSESSNSDPGDAHHTPADSTGPGDAPIPAQAWKPPLLILPILALLALLAVLCAPLLAGVPLGPKIARAPGPSDAERDEQSERAAAGQRGGKGK